MNPESTRILVQRTSLAFTAGAVGASLVFESPRFATSVLAGAAVETLNLNALWRSSQFVLGLADPKDSSKLALFGFGARFGLVALAMGLALYLGAHPVGLIIGLSLVVPAIVIVAWRTPAEIVEDAPALDPDDPEWDVWNPWLAREDDPEEEED